MKIGVVGGGSWGSALANVLADNGKSVKIYMRNLDKVKSFNGDHTLSYLPGVVFNEKIQATNKLEELLDSEIYLFALPTQEIRSFLEENNSILNKKAIFVNVAKGIEVKTGSRISKIFSEYIDEDRFVCLSGPTHAEEVARKLPSAIVASSVSKEAMLIVQDIFINNYLRVYTNCDLIGVELGGATKNILALGLGMVDGLGYGDNTKAAIMTRGMHEITRLGKCLGGKESTFYGLTGMGDLIVTATSIHSRNRQAGILLGKGLSLEEASKKVGMVVEGIPSTRAVYELSKNLGLDMPITNVIYGLLFEDLSPEKITDMLMDRERKEEQVD